MFPNPGAEPIDPTTNQRIGSVQNWSGDLIHMCHFYLQGVVVPMRKVCFISPLLHSELEEMSKGENIVKWIVGQRISWLRHLERIEEYRMPRKIFIQELEGTRKRERPRKRWKEEIERDLQVLGVRRWRQLVADRKKVDGHCSTGQSPQWALVPMEEEDRQVLRQVPH